MARTGIRGSNDLVWMGRAGNYAAKLSNFPSSKPTYITSAVYNVLNDSSKFGGDGRNMWQRYSTVFRGQTLYTSTWWWPL